MPQIILASQSPRRKNLLKQLGLNFKVQPSEVEERTDRVEPEDMVQDLALLKATDVAQYFEDSLIIGADTMVMHNHELLGKPRTEGEAEVFLNRLSNSVHSVYTGVALVKTNKNKQQIQSHTFFEHTKVWFGTLEKSDIQTYVEKGHPMDKAGAYGIQDDMGALFVEKIEGDFYNVVGFPLHRFYKELKTFMPELRLFN